MNDKLQQAYLRAQKKFLQYDGVLGGGYGTKISNGKPVIDESIIVFVEKKITVKSVRKEYSNRPLKNKAFVV
jgi:hypothetical protein